MRRKAIVVVVMGVFALAALPSATAADRPVTISAAGFVPPDVTIAVGDSVTWRNADTRVHQVVVAQTTCSLTIAPGASGSCTFRAGGKFNYRDPTASGRGFRGTITVTGPRASVTLAASRGVVPFGVRVTVSGVVSSQAAGETVSVSAQECGKTTFTRLGEATTTAGGNWTLAVKPARTTMYQARWRAADSPAATVKVRPVLRLTRVGSRFTVRVTAAQSFVGKYVFLQRYRTAVRRWATLRRVRLGTARTPTAGTVVTSARFSNRVRRGWRLRALLTQVQAGTCYVASPSNTLRVPS
jgi:plastocyanin